jgi:hypothetical protein
MAIRSTFWVEELGGFKGMRMLVDGKQGVPNGFRLHKQFESDFRSLPLTSFDRPTPIPSCFAAGKNLAVEFYITSTAFSLFA